MSRLTQSFTPAGHREDAFFLWSFDSAAEGPLPGTVVPEVWYHACHFFDPQRYSFYWQGKVSPLLCLPHLPDSQYCHHHPQHAQAGQGEGLP